MAMSSSSRSGCKAAVRLIALSPSLAVPTSCAPSARASSSWSRSAASGSSSAMSTRSGLLSAIRFYRHGQRHFEPAAAHRSIPAAGAACPARFEALADVDETEAGSLVRGGRELVLAAMLQPVADFEHHPVIVEVPGLQPDDD